MSGALIGALVESFQAAVGARRLLEEQHGKATRTKGDLEAEIEELESKLDAAAEHHNDVLGASQIGTATTEQLTQATEARDLADKYVSAAQEKLVAIDRLIDRLAGDIERAKGGYLARRAALAHHLAANSMSSVREAWREAFRHHAARLAILEAAGVDVSQGALVKLGTHDDDPNNIFRIAHTIGLRPNFGLRLAEGRIQPRLSDADLVRLAQELANAS